MLTEIKDNELICILEKSIYNMDVLHKCFYWYSGNFNIDINVHSENTFSVNLKSKSKIENSQALIEKIQRDLIDFKLRDIVTKETQTVRELIIAKAFAYCDLEADPTTAISDPVGFNPESIQTNG